ncbi:glucuronyl esterase domain-containing protein [Rufibacter tibetensis]|uniref:glucuronyl esterase domain-containing protein n=1 Tax=Rufibacter tibetensis TaxID=512763 RepID=UPI0009006F26|nr:T9SS type A sorting domain-containing protein [Rufibacter tibetensis]
MKAKITILSFLLSLFCQRLYAQIPLVYPVENTGANYTLPPLPTLSQLPVVEPLTDPFMWSDGSGRSTNFADWERRRNEIKAEIEHYEIGTKPTRPETITASFAPNATGGTLTVNVTVNGQTLTLTSAVILPTGAGPFPAVIGMNSQNGSVPANLFSSRNIARIAFNANQVTTYGNPQITNPYYRLYPDQNLDNAGQYSAWAWGVSRIIDGLELVKESLPIDLQHLAVTGCSYAGKMALFSGALDERIALTIAQESGGGGAPAWRVSETLGAVEKLGATDYRWFKDDMRQFAGANVSRLPHDHHELMAMIAPRALLVTGNTDFEWLANPSAYVSARATHEVYKTLGIGDRFGFYIDGGHGHCAIPTSQRPAIEAFVDKFLLGDASVNTDITVHPYPQIDHQRWYQWWGTGNPVLPAEPLGKRIWMEAECATVGSDWAIVADTAAAGGSYVTVKSGLNSTAAAPEGASGSVVFPFTVDSAATYNFVARLNAPSANDDSYWIKVDNGPFVTVNGLATSGWQWMRLTSANLTVGQHAFTIAYREDGAHLDKLLVTTSNATIRGMGDTGIDTGAPVVLAAGFTVALDKNGTRTIDAADVDWGSYDRCSSIASMTLDKSTFDCSNLGANQVTITVTDSNGNSASQTVTINVVDGGGPIVLASGFTVALDNNGTRTIDVADVDWGSYDKCGSVAFMSLSKTTFTCADLGANEVVIKVTDDKGNSSTETVTINVTGTCPTNTTMAGAKVGKEQGNQLLAFGAFPNPFTDQATIHFRSAERAQTKLVVYDATGRLVATLYDGETESSRDYQVSLSSQSLARGVYICRLIRGNQVDQLRLVVSK